MEAKKLMLGDYVKTNNTSWDDDLKNRFCKVEFIGHEYLVCVTIDGERKPFGNENGFEPIPLAPEILEKNGFKKDAFTNLSPDFYFGDDDCIICINLQSSCDKAKGFFIENRKNKRSIDFKESRHSLQKEPIYVHQLQHALRLCGIEKEILI